MKALLASIDGSATNWSEPLPPPARTNEEVLEALDGAFLRDVDGDALDRLRVLALALQAGAQLREDATFDEVRAAFSLATGRTPRANGAFSALLAMSLHTVWVPASLSTVWETPAFVIASSRQLAEDLDGLPACLHDADPDAAGDLFDLSYLIGCFREALAEAGESRCVVMTG